MISVVIPLYNKEKQIARTLQTVLDQTYQDFEIVIVNDGSTDGSVDEVKKFLNPRIRLINQKNGGVSAARNRGIEEAKGEYIAFLDADDVWEKEHLETLDSLIKRFPNSKARATNYTFLKKGIYKDIILNNIPFEGLEGVLDNYFEVASNSNPPIWSSAVCVDKDLLKLIGGFPEGITSGEDLITWARIALLTNFAFTRKVTATFILGDADSSVARRKNDKGDFVGDELQKMYLLNKNVKGLKCYLSLWYKMKAMNSLQLNDRFDLLCHSFKSLRYNMFTYKVYVYIVMAFLPHKVNRFLLNRLQG
jgi:glycosyltransferase involved in cell wall biosynthesis